ncbi:hypothetical protein AVEN_139368-1 [Araneus ventricosus]|uniref:Uncharacterized protein n=1 Tax=Araneus ventricosus TaxID=182803 RepID=A0A4Y2EDR1_ARAVE|nr:hypothetical protein AVEN_139368-1 [Araneus ventricosus]
MTVQNPPKEVQSCYLSFFHFTPNIKNPFETYTKREPETTSITITPNYHLTSLDMPRMHMHPRGLTRQHLQYPVQEYHHLVFEAGQIYDRHRLWSICSSSSVVVLAQLSAASPSLLKVRLSAEGISRVEEDNWGGRCRLKLDARVCTGIESVRILELICSSITLGHHAFLASTWCRSTPALLSCCLLLVKSYRAENESHHGRGNVWLVSGNGEYHYEDLQHTFFSSTWYKSTPSLLSCSLLLVKSYRAESESHHGRGNVLLVSRNAEYHFEDR